MYVAKAAETTFVQKMRTYKVDEIDGRGLSQNEGVGKGIMLLAQQCV